MVFEGILAQIPLFSHFGDEELTELTSKLHRRRFEKDQILFHKNDPGSTLYIIISGKVKIVLPSAEGDNVIVALLSTGDFFGELSLFDGEPRSATTIAVDSTEILTLAQEDFFRYLSLNPRASKEILGELSRRLRRTDELLSDAAFCNLSTRLSKRILELADRYGQPDEEGKTRVNMKLRQQDLADMVGATRESVNKMLKTYKQKSLIRVQRGFITIMDKEGLLLRAR
ncbi:MAG TPA: Crp/Fnr family transcriptional regulator [Nitrospinae bacterium]|nr:Crp/Fnr family transcriptional regulator [Nitrospinota bacterium]